MDKVDTVDKVKPEIILASSSPRRRQLLREDGIEFMAVDPPVCEPAGNVGNLPPGQLAEAMAYFKARSESDMFPDSIVLGADTVVSSGRGRIMGKASDSGHARQMLHELSGTRHAVITALAMLHPRKKRMIASQTTYVTMKPLTSEQIDNYLTSGQWRDKAGAYAIQRIPDDFIDSIEGSFTNVVGLPLELVRRMSNLC